MQNHYNIIFVTGKGGVGKSTVAAATALAHAKQGKRVLLAEMGNQSFYQLMLQQPVTFAATPWQNNVDVACWNLEEALREYLLHYLKFAKAADKVLSHKLMQALMGAAPTLSELAMLGKITAPMRHDWYKREYDVIVLDAFPSGQFMAMLRAPKGMAEAVSFGPMGRQTRLMNTLLSDASICEYQVVTLPEQLPISESLELAADIETLVGVTPKILCNKWQYHLDLIENGDGVFCHQMSMLRQRQTQLQQRMSAEHYPFATVPMQWQLDPKQLVACLAEAMQ